MADIFGAMYNRSNMASPADENIESKKKIGIQQERKSMSAKVVAITLAVVAILVLLAAGGVSAYYKLYDAATVFVGAGISFALILTVAYWPKKSAWHCANCNWHGAELKQQKTTGVCPSCGAADRLTLRI